MSTHLWMKDDIRNILISARITSDATAQCAPSSGMAMYLRGYRSALTAIAVACGISPEQIGFSPKFESCSDVSISDVELSLQASAELLQLAAVKSHDWE